MIVRPLAFWLPARAASHQRLTPRRRVARRAIIWGIVILLLTHLGMALAVETVAPQVRDPEYGYRQVAALKLQKAYSDRPLLLVIGTSRTQNGIDPSSMGLPDEPGAPIMFNAGLSGTTPIHLWLNYHRYRAAGIRPAYLLVEIFPTLLSIHGPPDYLFTETAPRLSFKDVRQLEPELVDPAALRHRWAMNRANSWSALRPVVLGNLAPQWQAPQQTLDPHRIALDRFGFTPAPFDTVPAEYRERKRAEVERLYAPAVRTIRVSELSDHSFRHLVADCRAAGVPVAFFITPESPTFRSWYTPESRAAVTAFCRMLTDELGCPVFEAPEGFGEEDFADGHHMLRSAARRFSRELADRHLKPWLASIR